MTKYSERSAVNGYDRRTAPWRPLGGKARANGAEKPGPLAGICEMPGPQHASADGVHFIVLNLGGMPTRFCGACWIAGKANSIVREGT